MNRLSRGEYVTIHVRNARTHIEEGRARFTDYEVEVKTNHMAFTVKNSKVRRRYSDFVWLRERLTKDLMTADPPILPGRKLFGRFNTDFIKQRQRRLQDFLSKVVRNNVYLSHVALHLFLQSKMSVEEMEEYIDSKNDEEPYDTILSESAFKTNLHKNETSFNGSHTVDNAHALKEDSGIESCGHELIESWDQNSQKTSEEKKTEDVFNDGNAADHEDNAEEEHELSDNNNTDEDQLEEDMRMLRLTSLPSLQMDVGQGLESSVEYLLSSASSSTSSDISDSEVIQEDEEIQQQQQQPQSLPQSKDCDNSSQKLSSGSTPKKSPSKHRRRRSRRRRTCIAHFDLPGEGDTGKQEEQDATSSSSVNLTMAKAKANIRRCFSFERKARPFPMFEIPSRNSFFSSRTSGSEERVRSRFSGSEERFRSPVKRKISLNEYCIVKRDHVFQLSFDENSSL
eukprot:gene19998-21959_t